MKEKENEAKVVEEPIVVEEKKENKIFATAKKIGKWTGIVLAGLGIGVASYYFGKKSGAASTVETETETI